MKKVLSAVCCLLLLTGCAKKENDPNTITLWHWMTDRHQALETLAQTYQEQTGIEIKIDLYAPSNIYSQRIVASAQGRALPDIYGILDKKKVFASFVKNGLVADLTDDFMKNRGIWADNLYEKS